MRSILILVLGSLLIGGCQTQSDKQNPTSTTLLPQQLPTRTQPQASATPGKVPAFDVDDCAARMQTLEGQLMMYYFKYQKLPMALDELRSVADPGEEVPVSCPVSHQPYIYNPAGLVFGTDVRRLVAYDASPAHSGTRWGILFGQAKGREPVNMQVIQIPEASMVGYHPAPASPTGPTTAPAVADEIPPDVRQRMEEQLRQQRLQQLRLRQPADNAQPGQQQPAAQPQQPVIPQQP